MKKLASTLEEVKTFASNPAAQRFHYISANLADANENIRVIQEVTVWNNRNPPDVVWANAGSAYPHLFLETDVETLRSQMDTNYWAAAYLAHTTLKAWTQPSHELSRTGLPRHFVITSSVLAYCGIAGYAPYSPAKSALRSLADTLQSEVQLYNGARLAPSSPTSLNAEIKIHIVLPGTILSAGHAQEQMVKHPISKLLEEGDPAQTEDQVAEATIKGLQRGEYMITTQFLGHLMRAGMIGGSPRNGLGVVDTMLSWITSIAWLFVGPDMERKVRNWGAKYGVEQKSVGDQHE